MIFFVACPCQRHVETGGPTFGSRVLAGSCWLKDSYVENCTVIEGNLYVTGDKTIERLPHLREITGHVMFYADKKVSDYTDLFPSLSIIRGIPKFLFLEFVCFTHPPSQPTFSLQPANRQMGDWRCPHRCIDAAVLA